MLIATPIPGWGTTKNENFPLNTKVLLGEQREPKSPKVFGDGFSGNPHSEAGGSRVTPRSLAIFFAISVLS